MSDKSQEKIIEDFFNIGAHFGLSKSKRHPSVVKYIYKSKNGLDVFDLEKTAGVFIKAMEFINSLGSENKKILFYTSRIDSIKKLEEVSKNISCPFMTRRWIGGILTNYNNLKKRVARLEELEKQKGTGDWSKYTKKEVILLERELNKLKENFGGFVDMKDFPEALFILDPAKEDIAISEAKKTGIPIIALANADADLTQIDYPIIANNKSKKTIEFFLDKIIENYSNKK